MSMGCGDYRCPANSNYHYGNADGLGVCYKSTTSPEQLDEYAEHCGFICVTDSWTQWKFGVSFKELICGNCQYFSGGTHGKCSADRDFGLYDDSRRYQGAHACKEFKKKEGENLAKKTYWTKCGIEFQKTSTAEVTGYELKLLPSATDPLKIKDNIARVECRTCPFIIDVTEGWGENKKHIRFECRAGSQKPNHKTDWTGSLDDKNTIGINSLDHDFMEDILEYCKDHPDLNASYNSDHLADCRRTLSISCSANKKGMAAKRELIDKFFSVKKDGEQTNESVSICIEDPNWDDKWSKSSDEKEYPSCNKNVCPFNSTTGECCFEDEEPESEYYNKDIVDAVEGHSCGRPAVLDAYVKMDEPGADQENEPGTCLNCGADKSNCEAYQFAGKADPEKYACEDWQEKLPTQNTPEKKKPRIGTESGCNEMREDCLCFCKHNDGCSVLLCNGNALEGIIKTVGDVDCDVYRKVVKRVNGTPEIDTPVPEIANDLAEIDTKSVETVTFDYSTVDADTAEFLQEKASKITEIRLKSVLAIGKELKEAQDKLANNKNGTFGAWINSIGITRQTAYNYINGYEFIVKNFDNIEAAEDLSPSLLFAAAKKDAPQELTEQVVSGDITSLKEYKALEEKLKAAETKAMAREKERDFEANKARHNYMHVQDLQQQLEQVKRNSDPAKVQELGSIITEKQQEIETLKKQLKDKPIEVPATKEKEVIPDEVRVAIFEKVFRLYEGVLKLTETEIRIFAEDVQDEDRENIAEDISIAANRLDGISDVVMDLNED